MLLWLQINEQLFTSAMMEMCSEERNLCGCSVVVLVSLCRSVSEIVVSTFSKVWLQVSSALTLSLFTSAPAMAVPHVEELKLRGVCAALEGIKSVYLDVTGEIVAQS